MKTLKKKSLSELSYYGVGGVADEVVYPETTEELSLLLKKFHQENRPYFFLGSGTNSLISDEPFNGSVIKFDQLIKLERTDHSIVCGAGVENTTLAQYALSNELAGAAWMNFLPGQLGATVRMNARCYGGEISSIASQVTTVTTTGEIVCHADDEMFRGYKDTIFMTNNEVITSVKIDLTPGATGEISQEMKFCENDRKSKGQFTHPSCGCVFKNDYSVGVPSGMLIEEAGFKGYEYKGAMVSPDHANFIFNINSTALDILELSFLIRDRVYEKFGVWLHYEMEVLGVLPDDLLQAKEEMRNHKMKDVELEKLRSKFNQKNLID